MQYTYARPSGTCVVPEYLGRYIGYMYSTYSNSVRAMAQLCLTIQMDIYEGIRTCCITLCTYPSSSLFPFDQSQDKWAKIENTTQEAGLDSAQPDPLPQLVGGG